MSLCEAEVLIQSLYVTRLDSVAREADNYFENLTGHDSNDTNINQVLSRSR